MNKHRVPVYLTDEQLVALDTAAARLEVNRNVFARMALTQLIQTVTRRDYLEEQLNYSTGRKK